MACRPAANLTRIARHASSAPNSKGCAYAAVKHKRCCEERQRAHTRLSQQSSSPSPCPADCVIVVSPCVAQLLIPPYTVFSDGERVLVRGRRIACVLRCRSIQGQARAGIQHHAGDRGFARLCSLPIGAFRRDNAVATTDLTNGKGVAPRATYLLLLLTASQRVLFVRARHGGVRGHRGRRVVSGPAVLRIDLDAWPFNQGTIDPPI
jgi:hypothetical protein